MIRGDLRSDFVPGCVGDVVSADDLSRDRAPLADNPSARDAAWPAVLSGLAINVATTEGNDIVDRAGATFIRFNDDGRHPWTHPVGDAVDEV